MLSTRRSCFLCCLPSANAAENLNDSGKKPGSYLAFGSFFSFSTAACISSGSGKKLPVLYLSLAACTTSAGIPTMGRALAPAMAAPVMSPACCLAYTSCAASGILATGAHLATLPATFNALEPMPCRSSLIIFLDFIFFFLPISICRSVQILELECVLCLVVIFYL